ncbi:hypothetical protein C8J56DRAFT_1031067 [Mycena floridula]|nr:hypothetical protein C8J56DRAFT_1031067 [Mycena floridula]
MVSSNVFRIVATILNAIAQITTGVKLNHRRRLKSLWIDDLFAFFALLCSVSQLVAIWITQATEGVAPMAVPSKSRLRAYWLLTATVIAVLWLSRLSLNFAAIRIISLGSAAQRLARVAASLIASMFIILLVLRILFCHRDQSWKMDDIPVCQGKFHLTDDLVRKVLNIGFDFISDLLLVTVPWFALIHQRNILDRRHLKALVGAGVILTCTSIVHVFFVIKPMSNLSDFTATIQTAVFLMWTNLPALISYLSEEGPGDAVWILRDEESQNSSIRKEKIGTPAILHTPFAFERKNQQQKRSLNEVPRIQVQSTVSTSSNLLFDELGNQYDFSPPQHDFLNDVDLIKRDSMLSETVSQYSIPSIDSLASEPHTTQPNTVKEVRFLSPVPRAKARDTISDSSIYSDQDAVRHEIVDTRRFLAMERHLMSPRSALPPDDSGNDPSPIPSSPLSPPSLALAGRKVSQRRFK